MKVIFLDFNGVLDTHDKMDEVDMDNLNRLKYIVDMTKAKVVISSSLKNSYYYTGKFSDKLKEVITLIVINGIEVIGITPKARSREEEIQKYLDEHPEIDNFVIIDDDYEMDMFKEHLVKLPSQMIEGQMGLDENGMNMAINILNKNKINFKKVLVKKLPNLIIKSDIDYI